MASDGQYWVDIYQGAAHLGAGFFITGQYVLTAHHCLRRMRRDDDTLDLHCPDGEVISGRLHQSREDADLALIEITKPGDNWISLPQPDLPRATDVWTDPYRPSSSDPYLKGSVARPALAYQCEGGASVEAIQLDCEQPLGDYSGYSGSPIERDDSDQPRLLGILLEQYPDRQLPERATGILFAATLDEALRKFAYFGLGHLAEFIGLKYSPRSDSADENEAPRRIPVDRTTLDEKIDQANALIRTLEDWAARKMLDPDEVRVMTTRIANIIVEQGIAEMTR